MKRNHVGNWEIDLKVIRVGRHRGQCYQKYYKGIPIPTLCKNSIQLFIKKSHKHYYIEWGLK